MKLNHYAIVTFDFIRQGEKETPYADCVCGTEPLNLGILKRFL